MDGIPTELLAHIALYLGPLPSAHRDIRACFAELLSLRCATRACELAVRRAAKEHASCEYVRIEPNLTTELHILALGCVFGHGCRELDVWPRKEGLGAMETSDVLVSALQRFVAGRTEGRLLRLSIRDVEISPAATLEMARACPRLETFKYDAHFTGADLHDFASELNRACPALEHVTLPRGDLSPAESYQMHFPRIKHLDLTCGGADSFDYEPTLYDQIEASARRCTRADSVTLFRCCVLPALATLLLSTPLRGRLTKLDLSGYTGVSDETILRFAEGCESLVDLQFPNSLILAPEFYAALARARPTLKILELWEPETECLQVVCASFALECLYLHHGEELTPAIIDMILQGPSSETLNSYDMDFAPGFNSADVLRLVRGCPRLANLGWRNEEIERYRHRLRLSPLVDGSNVDEINKLLEARGTTWGKLEPFPKYGPAPRRRRRRQWG
jgi:hypothetical protein